MRTIRKQSRPAAPAVVVRRSPMGRSRAMVRFATVTVPAAIGKGGVSSLKREGDGATPRASMRLISGYLRGERIPPVPIRLSMRRITPGMLWCDAPGHACYNRPVKAPFLASHETMLRGDHLYDVCLVMDWNVTMRRRNAGSAIFFHIARPGYAPTEGCVAVSLADMKRLLAFVRRGTRVTVL